MAFDGNEASPIDLKLAAEWTANYRKKSPKGVTLGHFFGKKILNDILNQPDCMGIRVYYAEDDNGQKQLIMVGAKADENDMVDGVIADLSRPCPPTCSISNALNSDSNC